ncbi:hypothetical protein JW824_01655 [bacterium]|nr:hypothetical protein [bacterium]
MRLLPNQKCERIDSPEIIVRNPMKIQHPSPFCYSESSHKAVTTSNKKRTQRKRLFRLSAVANGQYQDFKNINGVSILNIESINSLSVNSIRGNTEDAI